MEGIKALLAAQKTPNFTTMDGVLHFPDRIKKDQTEKLEELRSAQRKFAEGKGREPTPYYAMLDMDGDHMGKMFSSSLPNAEAVSQGLFDFATAVPGIVSRYDGVTIYAGADDVNAMLPIDRAIACAFAIRTKWQDIFATANLCGLEKIPTLSGSIVFADFQNALDDVRRLAHLRLDQVAKEECGRDALALGVMKSGGLSADWASQWDGNSGADMAEAVTILAKRMHAGELASKFPYKMRGRFAEIMDAKCQDESGSYKDLFDDPALGKLVAKELADSETTKLDAVGQNTLLEDIGRVLRPRKNSSDGKRHVGGLLIARFLSQKIDWEYAAAPPSTADGGDA